MRAWSGICRRARAAVGPPRAGGKGLCAPAEEARLVGRVAEDLQKVGAAQVEHELRVDGEVRREAEAAGVVLAVVGKLGHLRSEGGVGVLGVFG